MSAEPPFYLVWREASGEVHYRHPARDVAETEADRLARTNPGERFYVLVPSSGHRRVEVITVEVEGGAPVRFPLMDTWRDLPPVRSGHSPMQYSAVPGYVTDRVVAPPPATMPLFDAIAAANAIRFAEFDEIHVWPVRFKYQEKRNPTWGEIEAAWPRVGAWMAKMRSA